MDEDQLKTLRRRILLDWQVQRGTNVWAPWGKSGWSAVTIRVPQRRWAKGVRVKPHNGEEVSKGKVPKDRLIKRDPKLKGKDRPDCTPEEVFAHMPKKEKRKKPEPEPEPEVEVEEPTTEVPRPVKKSKPVDMKETWIAAIFMGKQGMTRAEAEAAWEDIDTDDDW